jgi:amino acid adenylation domain-containing protein
LQGITQDATQTVGRLPVLTASEQHQILAIWNDTQQPYPQDKCIHQLVEEQAERTPDAVAVVFEHESLTYQELNTRSNQLANYLRTLGVNSDVPVGICIKRSLAMAIGLLGILKAGGAYVPLDPTYPDERLTYMMSQAQASILLTEQVFEDKFSSLSEHTVCVDRDWGKICTFSSVSPTVDVMPAHLAYIIYTSGSTGRPKGVAMPHQALVNLISWQIAKAQISCTERTLQFAPVSFDVSFQEIFSTWCSGGTLVLMSDALRRDSIGLLEKLQSDNIARLFLPFVALQQLAEAAQSMQLFPNQLREVITAGEQLQITPAIRAFFSRLSSCTLHNHYGPSESHVVTAFTLPKEAEAWPTLPSIGKPIFNCQIYILDEHLQLVPPGVIGELYIGGAGLAREYIHRPEITAERFVTLSFTSINHIDTQIPNSQERVIRAYKTGDLAKYSSDGNIEYLGRADNQVKVRGFRIELGEVEAAIAKHPEVKECVVVVREDTPGDKRLVAYGVLTPGETLSLGDLRPLLRTTLPDYMVPSMPW